jgi:putative intracellular protease/amidase
VTLTGGARQVDTTVEAMPSVLWDAVVIPDGDDAVEQLGIDGRVLEFVKDQYRHCKPILAIGSATGLLQKAGVPETLVSGQADPGLLLMEGDDTSGVVPPSSPRSPNIDTSNAKRIRRACSGGPSTSTTQGETTWLKQARSTTHSLTNCGTRTTPRSS